MIEDAREASLEALLLQSSGITSSRSAAACCCGRASCAYLSHNNAALDGLEKDLKTAAQLGQALLIRHETYMAEAEKTRMEMGAKIENLETDKKTLEAGNAKTIEDNRALLNQLEELNAQVADSDDHVKSLEATLQATQQELRRLERLAQRTHDLEVQLAMLEQEQADLQQTLVTTTEEEKCAVQRWKKAERALREVEDQLERIEREAMEERKRHVEVVGRMERQRAVEKELDTAAGRRKGAAAATTLGQGHNGSNVVSHFVKDILQDNATLQAGIVELREMLMNSNEEVQALREQLMLHQPVTTETEDGEQTPTLKAELAVLEPTTNTPELHIHHHYHAPTKKEEIRKPKKKRNMINPALFTPLATPQSSRLATTPRRPTPLSTATTILANTSVSVPPLTPTKRWSTISVATVSDFASTAPSSPMSGYRNSAVFDIVDQPVDSSRPTSPGSSVDPMSPDFHPRHLKRGSEHSTRSLMNPSAFHVIQEEQDDDCGDVPELALSSSEDKDASTDDAVPTPSTEQESTSYTEQVFDPFAFQPTLRRSTSHESILSISGIDIHTLKSRPSQMTITAARMMTPSRGGFRPRPSLAPFSPALSFVSTEPVLSSSFTTARPVLSRTGGDSSSYLRSSMGMLERERPLSRTSTGSSDSAATTPTTKKSGGWAWKPWGIVPTPAAVTPPPPPPTSKADAPKISAAMPIAAKSSSPAAAKLDPLTAMMGRSPGVNQMGAIPGFRKPPKTPSKLVPDRVDRDALREVLME